MLIFIFEYSLDLISTIIEIMKSRNLTEAVKTKKQIEEDEQALVNRIKLLEREEEQAYKKAEEAQKQARNIYDARKAKMEQQRQRVEQA